MTEPKRGRLKQSGHKARHRLTKLVIEHDPRKLNSSAIVGGHGKAMNKNPTS